MFRLIRFFFRVKFLVSVAIPLILVAMLANTVNEGIMSANNIFSKGLSVIKQTINNIDFFNTDMLMADREEGEIATEEGKVVKHVDGDTFYVRLADGKDYKVRLIGVNCPESAGEYADNPQSYGKEASIFTKENLLGKKVYLEKDVDDKDRYGRLLRYVYIEKPKSIKEVEKKMFNAILIKEGYAQVMTVQSNIKYQDLFTVLQREAREDQIGLWGE